MIDRLLTAAKKSHHESKLTNTMFAYRKPLVALLLNMLALASSQALQSIHWLLLILANGTLSNDKGSSDKAGSKFTKLDVMLTLHSETKPITLIATKLNCYLSPILKKSVCRCGFTPTINRTN